MPWAIKLVKVRHPRTPDGGRAGGSYRHTARAALLQGAPGRNGGQRGARGLRCAATDVRKKKQRVPRVRLSAGLCRVTARNAATLTGALARMRGSRASEVQLCRGGRNSW